ncbi:YadA-like family protein [Burkholderia multivorans]|uniref:YadA-like family protein n=1 Tax=Burkholderia multivorans TaxID=87883 RepID=UPI003F5698A0
MSNNATGSGTSTGGEADYATQATISGSKDGHIVMIGGSGVHISGPVDFDNNVNMASHRINNLAAGVAGTDAVNLDQLNAAIKAAGDNPYVVTNTGTYAAATPAKAGGSGTAIGANANASGISAVALGGNTTATGQNALAIGTLSSATAAETVAVGVGANAQAVNSTALGRGAASTAANAVALGYGSLANRENSVSVGSGTLQRQITNLAAGTQNTDAVNLGQLNAAIAAADNPYVNVRGTTPANATGTKSIAIGDGAYAGNTYSGDVGQTNIAIGADARTSGGFGQIAFGEGASAQNSIAGGAIAIGRNATTTTRGVALGDGTRVTANYGVALGDNSVANRPNSVSVGSDTLKRQITNVAAGTQDTDAVNLAQLNEAIANVDGDSPYFRANGAGDGSDAANAVGTGSIAVGSNASTVADGGVAIGNNAASTMQNGVAIGNTTAASENAVAVGYDAHAMTTGSIAVGAHTTAALNATSLGFNARSASNAVALGANAVAVVENSVALGNGSQALEANSVSVGSAMNQRKIVNVAQGAVHAASTDAVNGSQLFGTAQSVADALGGGATVNADGTIGAPTYQIGGTDFNNVGDALTNLDGRTTANMDGIADLRDKLADSGLVDDNGNTRAAVTYDKNPDGTPNYGSVSLGGENAHAPVALKNVAAGKDDTDAVNVGQLKDSGLVGDDGHGNLTSLAVTYDDATKTGITLGNAGTPVAIHNVAAGELSATSTDVVNGSQLFETNRNVTNLGDQITNISNEVTDATRYFKANGLNDGTDDASATGTRAVAIGANANAVGGNAIALGANAAANGTSSLALGTGADASAMNSIALGANSIANQVGVVSVGRAGAERRIINVGDAQAGTDAVNLRTLEEKIGAGSAATLNQVDARVNQFNDQVAKLQSTLDAMPQAAADAGYFVADGAGDGSDVPTVAAGLGGLAAGAGATSSGIGGVAVGAAAKATGTQTTALGTDAQALNGNATAIGGGATANGSSSVAIGSGATTAAGANFATAIGSLANAAGGSAVAIGNGANAVSQSLALGTSAGATGANSVAMGFNAKANANNSVALGVGSQANRVNSVSVGVAGGERQITNVAAGTADTDAVNVKQLKDVGLVGTDPGTGDLTSLAVTYDDATKGTITLGGDPATGGTRITNVAAGSLSATSTDAVNGSQLFATNTRVGDLEDTLHDSGLIDPATGESLAVVYDSAAKDKVTLGGANASTPVTLSNVNAGVADTDAVNVSQLKGSGLIDDNGKSLAAVTYDDATKGTITLGGDPATGGTRIKNVAAGELSATSTDAVNGSQLFATNNRVGDLEDTLHDSGLIDPGTGESLAVVYDSAAKDKVTLGGANASTPVTLSNVNAGVADTDAVNVSQLKGSGLIGDDGKSLAAVTYGTNPDGTPNYDAVELGGGKSAGPVQLSNVADGVDRHDAVNLGQLQDAGLVAPVDPSNPGSGLASLAVTYGTNSDGSANFGEVALKGTDGTTLSNVKAGVADMDAVNVSQLKGSGLIDDNGKSLAAVTYDDATKGTITLGGDPATGGTRIKNVAAGELSATSTDAVNGSQLFATNNRVGDLEDSLSRGGVIDPGTGESLAVVYDSAAKDKVTLGGANASTPVTLSNVNAGIADTDAVNVSQLKGSGLIDDNGKSLAAVTYDDATLSTITLGGIGGTRIANVAAGNLSATSTDAVNGAQLFATNNRVGDLEDTLHDSGLIDPATGESLAVVYDSAAKDKVTLGGANASTPVTLSNVNAGVADTDAVNVSQLKGSGLIDDNGKSLAAVTYDDATKSTITLGGDPATGGTQIKNVANGVDANDAVNVSQLDALQASTGDQIATATRYFKANGLNDGTDDASATGTRAVAVGANSRAAGGNAIALGANAAATGMSSLALGTGASASAMNSVALGANSIANQVGVVSVGQAGAERRIVNVGDAQSGTDAVNLRTLDAKLTSSSSATLKQVNDQVAQLQSTLDAMPQAGTGGEYFVADGDGSDLPTVAVGQGGLAAGAGAESSGIGGIAVGAAAKATGTQTTALGADAQALNGNATAVGGGAIANGSSSVAIGSGAMTATGADFATAIGSLASATGASAVAIGNGANAARQGLAIGTNAGATGNNSTAMGYGAMASAGNAVALGAGSRADRIDSVSVGVVGGERQIVNVAEGTAGTDAVNVDQMKKYVADNGGGAANAVTYDDPAKSSVTLGNAGTPVTVTNVAGGAVNATSTDAINGSQLHGTAQSVADSLGGGSTVDANGNVTNPTYSLADPADASHKQDYRNVGDALANLDGRVVDNTTNITVIQNQLADSGLVDPLTGQSLAALTYDRNADGTPNFGSVTLGNGNGPVRVSNVADGVARHDAVNLGQLQDAGLVAPTDPNDPGAGLASLAVTYDKHADGSANFDRIALAGANGTTITNVKAGAVNATSTDAVNGAQLHGVAQSVADSLGGGSTVDADGNVTTPTYVVNNQTFSNVGDAITNISNSLADGSIGLVQQDETTRDITVAKDTDGTLVDFAGTAGERVLTGVAAGAVNATSTDAINGSQLYGTAQSVADAIGGGTTVDANGQLVDTAIEVNGSKYKTVAEAVQAAAQYGATDSLAVRYDLNADGTPNYGSVTLGGTAAAPVVLTNVADGVNKYDAVNFGQLSELRDQFSGLDDRVGALEGGNGGGGGGGDGGSGDSPYFAGTDIGARDENPANAGTGTGNTAAGSGAKIGGSANNGTVIGSGSNVSKDNGTAIGSGASSTGEGATAIGSGATASGNQSVAIGAGSVASDPNTVSFGNGTDEGNRRIVNIADGVNANDAASKGQLDRAVGGLQGQINDMSRNAYSGIAAATALTMIPGVDPGKTLSFGVGGATYKGYQAVAFGGEARITQNLKMKAGVGLSSGGNTVGVGASYQW